MRKLLLLASVTLALIPQPTYVICDVAAVHGNAIEAVMPNGEIDCYEVTDAPEECDTVCFKTRNQDNYTTYKVVALR